MKRFRQVVEARGPSHTFGSRLAKANRKSTEHASLPPEEWAKRGEAAHTKHKAADEEGQRRKDKNGAYPKDVLRRMDAARREMDLARQYGKWEKK